MKSRNDSSFSIRVTELGRHGDGIAVTPDGRIFVPGALAGEVIQVRPVGKTHELLEVLEPSQERRTPTCPHFSVCGGCSIQHLSDEAYREWKSSIVSKALEHKGLDTRVAPFLDAHGEGRRRVTLHVRFSKGRILVGFMQASSHRLFDLDRCPILVEGLENVTDIARRLSKPFTSKGKPFDIRITDSDSGLDCDFQSRLALDLDSRMDLAEVAEEYDLARITVMGDIVLERRKPVLTMGNTKVTLPPGGFLQATGNGEETLSRLVLEGCEGATSVADLFCGVGPFALRLAAQASVLAVDNDEAAVKALDQAWRHGHGLKPVKTEVRNLKRNPLHVSELNGLDAIVFDPPRAGAEYQAHEIATSNVSTVIAVSCDPASFARDAAILISGGYRLERVTPVDQFRYASHIEVVGLFRK